MKRSKLFFLFALVLIANTGWGQDGLDGKIMELLRIQQIPERFDQQIDAMFDIYKTSFPQITDEFIEEFKTEASKDEHKELLNMFVPIYKKHYSEEEIDKQIEFYSSPIGVKILSKQELIMKESIVVGQNWGKEIGQKMQEKLANQ